MNKKLAIGIIPVLMAICMGQTTAPATGPLQRAAESDFGTMPDGSAVKLYTLTNAKGMQVRVCSFGGTIAGVKAADKDGAFINVVACADTWQAAQRYGMQAQTIGRVANRINGGKFTIDGKEYTVGTGTVLHSGNTNFGTKNWQGEILPAKDHEAAVRLTITSKDGDGGFPGNFTLKVTYALNDDNEFSLTYEATSDKTTPVNVTNHAYWNLAGSPGFGGPANPSAAADEELWIDADKYLPVANLIPTGELAPVKGTPNDFTTPTVISSRATRGGYDTPFVLNSGGGKLAVAARLRDPKSGRVMEVRTDQPGLQLYTGQRGGVALETQHHPDSVHQNGFPTTILKAGETFKTTTVFAFSAK